MTCKHTFRSLHTLIENVNSIAPKSLRKTQNNIGPNLVVYANKNRKHLGTPRTQFPTPTTSDREGHNHIRAWGGEINVHELNGIVTCIRTYSTNLKLFKYSNDQNNFNMCFTMIKKSNRHFQESTTFRIK